MIPADEPDPLLATTRLRGWLLIAVLFSTVLVIALGFVLMRSATQRTLVIAPNEHHLGGASSFQPSADLIRYAILTLTVRMETWTPQSLEIMADDVLPLFAATKHDEIRGQIQANLAEAKASRMQRACYPLKVMSETASNGVHTVGVALTTSDLVRDPNGLVAISRADDAIVMYTVVLDRPTAGNPLGLRIEALERIPRSVWVGDRHLPDYWTNTP
jgi:hypothetical protein